jgi:hypothetical protein
METTKSVNPTQLQTEALALTGSEHVSLTLLGVALDATGIAPAGGTLLCCDAAGSSETHEPCQWLQQAYDAHTAAPNPVDDPLKPYRDALASAAEADASLTTATKTALQNLLAAMAPQG